MAMFLLQQHLQFTSTRQTKKHSAPKALFFLKKGTFCHVGEYEKGVDHLTNAIAVCGQPQQLLQVLQQTLPPPVFQMLLTKLPTISQVRIGKWK